MSTSYKAKRVNEWNLHRIELTGINYIYFFFFFLLYIVLYKNNLRSSLYFIKKYIKRYIYTLSRNSSVILQTLEILRIRILIR